MMVLMVDSTDHITGKTGLTLTITLSKGAGAFASVSPTVTERSYGWYKIAWTSSDTDTLGEFSVHVTGTGADPADPKYQIVAAVPDVNIAKINSVTILGDGSATPFHV